MEWRGFIVTKLEHSYATVSKELWNDKTFIIESNINRFS
jgi:hypothetical protein